MQTKIVKNLGELNSFVEDFFSEIIEKREKALVFGLRGDLGSGKTTFVQTVAKYFEIEEFVTSPTFVIQKKYKIKKDNHFGFENLIHIDAYRLEKAEEILMLDWEENISNSNNLIFVEWPEKIKEALPKNTKEIFFEFVDEITRKIIF